MTNSNGLPARRVRLYGREADAEALRELLATSRGGLVTILGTGGCGKTSLAVELAHQAVPAFADDGYWVPLDECRDGAVLAAAVASAMGGLPASSASTEDALVENLAARQALLVLDNCEHLAAAVARLLERLMTRCVDLRILATSRTPLSVRGEHVYRLSPLEVPDLDHRGASPALEEVPSVALFLDRSRAAGQRGARGRGDLEAIGRICARLDGLPLAIELAAAQTLTFSPVQIEQRLLASLPLPARAPVVAPERQRTMEAALDWSYELLTADDQELFARCSVFAGSWTLDALQAVAADGGDVSSGLARLVEASLVSVVDSDDERRYRLLAPVREYAQEKLEQSGRLAELQNRHARHYVELVERVAGRAWAEPLSPLAVQELSADHENFLAALAYSEATGELDLARRLAAQLWVFWRITGRLHLGLERFEALLAMDPPSPLHRGLAHAGVANFAQLLGDKKAATRHALMALSHYREAASFPGQAMVLGTLAEVAAEARDYEEARRRYREVISMVPDGRAANSAVGLALLGLGFTEYWDRRYEESESLLRQGIERLGRRVSWHQGLAHVRFGGIARTRGRLAEAIDAGRRGLEHVHKLGGDQEVALALEELAATEAALGRFSRAATLLGKASNLREATRSTPAPADAPALAATTASVRGKLNDTSFTAAWVNGRTLSRPEAVAYALGDTSPSDQQVAPLASLTSREMEVAQLVSEGLSNHQIADRLVISEATARTHVERIRSKLGVRSRVAVARLLTEASTAR